jgi:Ras-related protein Rab-2A
VAIIVYDITNRKSFMNTREWLQEVRDYSGNPNICLVLVGNKKDDEDDRQVSEEEGQDFADKNGLLFFEASAKSSENVEMIFTTSATIFYEKFKDGLVDFKSDAQGVTLGPKQMTFGGRGLCLC